MKQLLCCVLLSSLLIAGSGCFPDWTLRQHSDPPPAQTIEKVKPPPKPIRPEDVDPNNPRAAVDALNRELDIDQTEAQPK